MKEKTTYSKRIWFFIRALFQGKSCLMDEIAPKNMSGTSMLSCLIFCTFLLIEVSAADKIKIEEIRDQQNTLVDQEKIATLSNALNSVLDWQKTNATLLDGRYSMRNPVLKWVRWDHEYTKGVSTFITYMESSEDEPVRWFASPKKWGKTNGWSIFSNPDPDQPFSIIWHVDTSVQKPKINEIRISYRKNRISASRKIQVEQIRDIQGKHIIDQDKVIPLSVALSAILDWCEINKAALDGKYSIRKPILKWKRTNAVKSSEDDAVFPITYHEDIKKEVNRWIAAPQAWGPTGRWRIRYVSSQPMTIVWYVDPFEDIAQIEEIRIIYENG